MNDVLIKSRAVREPQINAVHHLRKAVNSGFAVFFVVMISIAAWYESDSGVHGLRAAYEDLAAHQGA